MANSSELAAIRPNGSAVTPAPSAAPALPDAAALRAAADLLKAAGQYVAAQRPIVLHGPAQAVPGAPSAGHPGISVTIPGPAAPEPSAAPERTRRLFTRAEVNLFASMATMGTASLSAVAAGNWQPLPISAAAALWMLVSGIVIFVQDGPGRGGRT